MQTFDEWFNDESTHAFGHFLANKDASREVWEQAQRNYPFAIADEAMEETTTKDAIKGYHLSQEQAVAFTKEYGAIIVDNMWDEYYRSLADFIAMLKTKQQSLSL